MEAVHAQPAVPLASVIADDEILRRRAIGALRRDGIPVAKRPGGAVLLVSWTGGWRSTLERATTLRTQHPGAAVLVIATHCDVRELPRLVAAGIAGVVLESDLESTAATAVRAVLCGQLVFPAASAAPAEPVLSNREKQVLAMVVLGCTNGEIAAKLHVTETTVKSHLTSVFRKLGVRSRSEASARVLDPKDGLGIGMLTIAEPDPALEFVEWDGPA